MYQPLKISYNHLESDEARYVFLLCSLFEEDSDIWTEELLRYGMRLGIFSELGNLERARNRVSHLLETLKDCFLLSQGSDKSYVKMHDVVRDMAIYIASEGEHKFMVNHNVNSDEFPRNHSYEQYNHMSIVANKFDEHPRPISCPRLVSNLRTLCLTNLIFDGISIIGELVTLEILSFRDSYLEELPVEIGNLTNLTMLEYWNTGYRKLMRIPPGVLSRLVRLEELHVVGVKGCSYSTLREMESLSRLTALALDECSVDVIYRNLGLSSKLTRYALTVGGHYMGTSIMETYNKIIALQVTESTPLGDWIRLLLRNSEFVCLGGKGSKNVLVELQNVKDLILTDCDSLNIHYQNNIPFPKLERLKVCDCYRLRHLFYASLACPDDEEEGPLEGHISDLTDAVEGIEFPLLREMHLKELPEFQNFWPRANNAITDSNPLFNEKVSCPNLELLRLYKANSISALCSHQLSTAYFNKLETLEVLRHSLGVQLFSRHSRDCRLDLTVVELIEIRVKALEGVHSDYGDTREDPKLVLRHSLGVQLLSRHSRACRLDLTVARGLLNLRTLSIRDCESIEEVITEGEQEGDEIMCNDPLFPVLDNLVLYQLPKLGHFILSKQAFEFPFLKEVDIRVCPKMKAFIQQGTVSTPSLESVNNDDELKVVDTMFNSKVSCPNLEVLKLYEANNITALCSHQLPTAYFSKLVTLEVENCGKLRNLMSPSVARGFLNLQTLWIQQCQSMEEVIAEEEQQGDEIMTNEPLFSRLEELMLNELPKFGHFFLTKRTLQFPFLRKVWIIDCPEMKTFFQQGTVSTPSLEIANNDDVVKVDDLNKWIHQRFNSKEEDGSESEDSI
ncbi:hypothetical protein CQW23_25059 [Capsicum baccatum]|uniref:Disease resistance protein At4g27190-like leucine-rich repeats domain-containing protein n=1 Tax=Capsicum baccatum TaxID=33114 RepID=A0A2G2VWL8_CAPBA|nr:hypothetical protein CQW23_25059 [Capsicum baccatum]